MPPLDATFLANASIIIFAILGLILFLMGIRRLLRSKIVSGSFEGLVGLLLVALAALIVAISMNLHTYSRLSHESQVAEIRLQATSPQLYNAYLFPKNYSAMIFDLRGDEWQIDARILKWRGMAVLLGFDTIYRFHRLSGRYRDLSQERTRPRTVYDIGPNPGIDLWTLMKKHGSWIPWIDTVYGSATYMPMVDGARYTVSVTASGLLARPANDTAQEAVRTW